MRRVVSHLRGAHDDGDADADKDADADARRPGTVVDSARTASAPRVARTVAATFSGETSGASARGGGANRERSTPGTPPNERDERRGIWGSVIAHVDARGAKAREHREDGVERRVHRAALEGGGGVRQLGEEEGMKRGETREEIIPVTDRRLNPPDFACATFMNPTTFVSNDANESVAALRTCGRGRDR